MLVSVELQALNSGFISYVTIPTPEEPTINSEPLEVESTPKRGFLPATYEELKLVVWPGRQQLFSESIAVILMVTLSAAAIAAISRFYGWGASLIFGIT